MRRSPGRRTGTSEDARATKMLLNPKSKIQNPKLTLARRALLQNAGMGLGSIALGWLLGESSRGELTNTDPVAAKPTHFAPRAKSVIFLHMVGAPSQLD